MDKQETNYKECEGCGPSSVTCLLKPYYINQQGNKIECPCITCLIKGICIDPCDKIQDYYVFTTFKKIVYKV